MFYLKQESRENRNYDQCREYLKSKVSPPGLHFITFFLVMSDVFHVTLIEEILEIECTMLLS